MPGRLIIPPWTQPADGRAGSGPEQAAHTVLPPLSTLPETSPCRAAHVLFIAADRLVLD